MKKAKRPLKVDVSINLYDAVVSFYFMDTNGFIEAYRKESGITLVEESYMTCFSGITINAEQEFKIAGSIVVFIKDFYKSFVDDAPRALSILAHESLHSAVAIMENRGVPVTAENDEALAYLQDCIICEVLKKTRILEK